MASADSNFDEFFCSVFNLDKKNVNELTAPELSGFTCTSSLTNEREIFYTALGGLLRY